MTPDHDQPNGGWRDIAEADVADGEIVALWNGVVVTAGTPWEGGWADYWYDWIAPQPTHYQPLPAPPHDRKPSSENRQEVSSSKDGML